MLMHVLECAGMLLPKRYANQAHYLQTAKRFEAGRLLALSPFGGRCSAPSSLLEYRRIWSQMFGVKRSTALSRAARAGAFRALRPQMEASDSWSLFRRASDRQLS